MAPENIPRTTGERRFEIRIHPGRASAAEFLREFWVYRDLLYFLTMREVSVRYKQTALGVLWVVLQPLLAALVFAVVLGRWAHIPSSGTSYPLFVYSSMVLWNLFSQGITRAGDSIIADEKLVTKVYFPRAMIPLGAAASTWVDFAVSFALLAAALVWMGGGAVRALWLLPVAFVLTAVLTFGLGALISSLNVRYRDFRYITPFLLQIGLYLSPVVYPASLVPARWRTLYFLNPMAGLLETFRYSLFGRGEWHAGELGISAGMCVLVFAAGLLVFRWVERGFSDYI
jgi:lipopolysaccharide transport system permease protein